MCVTFEANTVLIFSTGKMVIIGAKTEDAAKHSLGLVIIFLKQYRAERL